MRVLSPAETSAALEVAANLIRAAARQLDSHCPHFPADVQLRLEGIMGLGEVNSILAREVDEVAAYAIQKEPA